MGEVHACQGCGYGPLTMLLDMGNQPVPEGARAGKRYPLHLVLCPNCGLAQLDYKVPQDELFAADHPYSTGNSPALREHYQELAVELFSPLKVTDLIVDIGANDGTFLDHFPRGLGRVAVEPTDQGKKIPSGITWEKGYFTDKLARGMREGYGLAKVITACNVLAHVPDVHDFLNGVTALLHDDGLFVTENHDLYSILDGNQIDTVYHEHLRYYSVSSLSRLLEQHGLRVERVIPVDTHGGSFRTYARKAKDKFPGSAKTAATALRGMLWKLKTGNGNRIYGIGAATRAVPLIHYAGIEGFLDYVCEVPGGDKIGQLMPGTQIPVVPDSVLIEDQPPYALLLAWHLKDSIVPRLRAAGYTGKFIVPLPYPEVLDD